VLQRNRRLARVLRAWQLYVLLLVPVLYLFIFNYIPIYGVTIAFKDYSIRKGILGSPWVGLYNFRRFVESYAFERVIVNTVLLSLYLLVLGFPVPILLAVSLNYAISRRFKKTVQMVTYAPYFLSTVVMVGLITQLLTIRFGIVNHALDALGLERIDFLGSAEWFRHVYVWSEIWQKAGYDAIIYIAALSTVDPNLHEAAIVDGASKWRRILHIDIPTIVPTIVILFIMRMGRLFSIQFEKVFLMQSPLNLKTSEVIATYVYKVGLSANLPDFSFGTAIGLFQSVIGLVLLIMVNLIASRVSETSLW
jgi:multiple sugar transport system permease protein/putative aldouronate transport system permease protein